MSKRQHQLPIADVVRAFYVGPLPVKGEGAFTFRVEIARESRSPPRYVARLWRFDHYRVRPSFPDVPGTEADEEMLVADVVPPNGVVGRSAAVVQRRVLNELRARFGEP
jgi:hypothetical protein